MSKDGITQHFTRLLATATGEKVAWSKLAEKNELLAALFKARVAM